MAISPYTDPEYYNKFLKYSIDSTVAFAGSGCSSIPGIPTWRYFVEKLKDEVNTDINIVPLIEQGKVLEAASLIYDALINPSDFYDGISDLIRKNRQAYFHDLHTSIWNTFNRIITTNYDDCFEHAFVNQNAPLVNRGIQPDTLTLQQIPTLNFDSFEGGDKSIAYIHGRAGSQNLILRKEDYQKYYPSWHPDESPEPSDNLEEFLKLAVEKYSFVFIGFSLDDEDFVKSFETFRENYKEVNKDNPIALTQFANRNHFIFLLNDDLKDWVNIEDIKRAKLSLDKIYDAQILQPYDGVDSERMIFRRNFQSSFDRACFTPEERSRTIALSERLLNNKRKLQRLEKLNILDIRIPGKDFKAISSFLTGIKKTVDSADEIDINDI